MGALRQSAASAPDRPNNIQSIRRDDDGGNLKNTDLVEMFLFWCESRGLRPKTIRSYKQCLDVLCEYADQIKTPLAQMSRADLQRWIVGARGKWAIATINLRLRHWRVFYGYLATEGYVVARPGERHPMDLIKQLREDRHEPNIPSVEDMVRVFGAFRKSFTGQRDRCIMMMFYDTGLRLSELINLRLDDVDLRGRIVRVRIAKNHRERRAPFSSKLAYELKKYMDTHRKRIPGDVLFCFHSGAPLHDMRVYHVVRTAGNRVGLRLHPHLLRHAFATEYLRAGGSVSMLQGILGHSDIRMTQRYTHLVTEDIVGHHDAFSPLMRDTLGGQA